MTALFNFTDFNYVYTSFCVEADGAHFEFARFQSVVQTILCVV